MAPGSAEQFIEWDDERYSTAIDRFDEQHKRLFTLLNDLHTAMDEGHSEETVGDILRELERYTEYHFGDEEEFMQDCGYAMDCADCFFNHTEAHEEFAETVSEFRERHENGEYITMEVLTFVRDWLDSHIAGLDQDQKYSDYYHDEVPEEYDYTPGTLKRNRDGDEQPTDDADAVGIKAPSPVEIHEGQSLSVPAGPVADWFADRAAEYEERPAAVVREGDEFVERTFDDLYERARGVAGGLLAQGLDPGDRVGLLAPPCYDWSVVDLACHLAGLVSVPIYHRFDDEQARHVVEATDLSALIAEPGTLPAAEATVDAVFPIQDLPSTRPGHLPGFDRDPDDVATIVYRIGTNDSWRGCLLTHENLLAAVAMLARRLPLDPGVTGTCFLPLAHSYQRVATYYLWDSGGAPAYLRIDDLVDDLAAVQPAVLVGVPQVYERLHEELQSAIEGLGRVKRRLADGAAMTYGQAMADDTAGSSLTRTAVDRLVFSPLRNKFGLANLEYALSSTARVDAQTLYFLWGCGVPVRELYGATELAGVATLDRARSFDTDSVGTPLPGVEVGVTDDGRIVARGPNVVAGYWETGAQPASELADGWFDTGDYGRFDEHGALQLE